MEFDLRERRFFIHLLRCYSCYITTVKQVMTGSRAVRGCPRAHGGQPGFPVRLVLDPEKSIPAAQVPAAFERALQRCGARPRTVQQYGRHAAHFVEALRSLAPETGEDIRRLTTFTLLRYIEADLTGLRGQARAPSTRVVRINAIRALLRGLDAAGALRHCGPDDLVAPHLPPPAPASVVPADRRAAFFTALRGSNSPTDQVTHTLGVLFLMSALRVSEACALDLTDLAFHDRTATVQRKGGAVQAVPLAPQLAALLYQYVSYIRPHLPGARTTDALFVSRAGRISVNEVERRFRVAGRRVGLTPRQCQPHRLRATAITMVAVGQGPLQAMTLANHKRLETTLRYIAPGAVGPPEIAAKHGTEAATMISLPALPPPAFGTTRSPLSAAAGLSPRQQQVFELIGQGRSERQIAASLGINYKTARRHVAEMFAHLGGASAARALATAEVAAVSLAA